MWLARDGSRELHITSKEGEMTATETVLVGCDKKTLLNKLCCWLICCERKILLND